MHVWLPLLIFLSGCLDPTMSASNDPGDSVASKYAWQDVAEADFASVPDGPTPIPIRLEVDVLELRIVLVLESYATTRLVVHGPGSCADRHVVEPPSSMIGVESRHSVTFHCGPLSANAYAITWDADGYVSGSILAEAYAPVPDNA